MLKFEDSIPAPSNPTANQNSRCCYEKVSLFLCSQIHVGTTIELQVLKLSRRPKSTSVESRDHFTAQIIISIKRYPNSIASTWVQSSRTSSFPSARQSQLPTALLLSVRSGRTCLFLLGLSSWSSTATSSTKTTYTGVSHVVFLCQFDLMFAQVWENKTWRWSNR